MTNLFSFQSFFASARSLSLRLLLFLVSSFFSQSVAQLSLINEGPYLGGDLITIRYQTEEAKPTNWLAIAPLEAPLEDYLDWDYAPEREGEVTLRLPETPQLVEIRFLEVIPGRDPKLLAKTEPLEVIAPSASLSAPAQLTPGEVFMVYWEGPGRDGDQISLAALGSSLSQALETQPAILAGQLQFTAPQEPGFYELRYLTGQSNEMLALQTLEVVQGVTGLATEDTQCSEVADEDSLETAFDREVSTFMAEAYRTYGDQYSDANYSYDTSTSISGTDGRVSASYRATLTTKEGETIQSSGVVEATFSWSNCAWSLTGYSY